MESQFKGLYDKLPVSAQNLALTLFSVKLDRERYGAKFREFQGILEQSQWQSEAELVEYQEEKLRFLMKHCWEHVPYYRQRMKESGLKPGDFQSVEDLAKMPVLTKQDIRENFRQLLATQFSPDSVARGNTSGTTGTPLEVCYDDNVIAINYAMLDRQFRWAGCDHSRFGDRVAVIRGNVIVPLSQKRPPYWRQNYLHRQLLLSSFHLSEDTLPYYIGVLRQFRPKVLDGYPSTLYILARFLRDRGEQLKLDAVMSSSETLYDFQRETIEASFGCRMFDYFGAAERVLFATECSAHEGHHLASEYGITEFVDDDNHPVNRGATGKIVATSLHNLAMPLIRYVTNDVSALLDRTCSCGRQLPLMEDVATKAEDTLILPDGRYISPSVLTHPFKPITSIQESQVVQLSRDEVVVKVVPGRRFQESDRMALVHGLTARLGQEVRIEVQTVKELERTRNGKFKWVVCKVTPNSQDGR